MIERPRSDAAGGCDGTKSGHKHQVVAVCRDSSAKKLNDFARHEGFTMMPASAVSDETNLTRALDGCDAAVVIMIAVRSLKATRLVESPATATATNGVRRIVCTAGEITVVREHVEAYNLRQ